MLRHPVVITSVTEDFKKIGLLKEEKPSDLQEDLEEGLPKSQGGEVGSGQQGHKPNKKGGSLPKSPGGEVGSGEKSHRSNRDPNHDYGEEEDFEDEDSVEEEDLSEAEAAYLEAREFAEEFAAEWDSMVEDEVEQLELSNEEMEELEGMGESVSLDMSIFEDEDEDDDFDEDFDEDDDDLDEDEVEEGRRRAAGGRSSVRTKRMSGGAKSAARAYYRKNKTAIKKSRLKRSRTSRGKKLARLAKSLEMSLDAPVANAMEHISDMISGLYESEEPLNVEPMPAFANIALVSEMLAKVFNSALQEGYQNNDLIDEMDGLAESYADMARSAAEAVEFLHEHQGEELDEEAISEAFADFMQVVKAGLEIYEDIQDQFQVVSEDEDEDDSDDDLDDDGVDEDEDEESGKDENAA